MVSGPDQVSSAEEHCGHANSTRPIDLLGPTGTPSAEPNLRRGSILRAGQNVQSGHQENHTEHRVARETIARSRSTRSNWGRAQVRTSTAHGHGTRATRVSGRSAEDAKIMVKPFSLKEACKRTARRGTTPCRASTYSVWQSLTHKDQSEGRTKATRAARDNGVTRVFHLTARGLGSPLCYMWMCPTARENVKWLV